MSRQLKLKPGRKRIFAIYLVCTVLVIVIAFVVYQFVAKPVDCTKVLNNATKLSQSNHVQQAYDQLKSQEKTCTAVPSKSVHNSKATKEKVQAVTYSATEAGIALRSGDNKQAYASTSLALTTIRTMSNSELNQLPNRNALMAKLFYIQMYQKLYGSQQ